MMSVLARIASVLRFSPTCPHCGGPRRAHVAGRCHRDIVIGRDVERAARMERLAQLQRRVAKVRPWGIGE